MYGGSPYGGFPYGGVGSAAVPSIPGFTTGRLVPAAEAAGVVLGAAFTDTATVVIGGEAQGAARAGATSAGRAVPAAAADGRDERAGT